jgi:hypothetical protein
VETDHGGKFSNPASYEIETLPKIFNLADAFRRWIAAEEAITGLAAQERRSPYASPYRAGHLRDFSLSDASYGTTTPSVI